ncbi:tRNA (adenosine(37)-N6)-threonylcarbamoyltransferase complex dimerization subunit type 1 TsaB [Bryobacter aggregatus]|uniref:tRNA (adenosine(37)-N6)-threonylcarbamoyltransferase complex dimerization subunit type 1 TsaB n=1 Tax=Bryobacter aggregatus TaxID=360054 RepID=UPI00068BB056|nr:tRNA (adenosine(37)-N6)-threonylcarbamoyltransferase complex dimerization subunit type 1 TsaB [Bryobacter aggregatus]
MILAIDTTHDDGSIALVHNGAVLEEVALHAEDGFSSFLFTAVQQLLDRHQLSLEDIDAFAAAAGPGTFTGIRIGLTAAKGFGEAMAKPVFGISNLEAVASYGPPDAIPFYDARRGDVYALLGGQEVVIPYAQLPRDQAYVTFDPAQYPETPASSAPRALAATIAQLAERQYQQGARPDAASLDANYVRRSDAELNLKAN